MSFTTSAKPLRPRPAPAIATAPPGLAGGRPVLSGNVAKMDLTASRTGPMRMEILVDPPSTEEEAELLEGLLGKAIQISLDYSRPALLMGGTPAAEEEAPAGVETSDSDTGSW